MGGHLAATSVAGEGSTFTLALPLPLAEPPKVEAGTARRAEATAAAWPEGHGPRILVAEDNVVNQRVAIRTLEKFGCRVDLAVNGREAIERNAVADYALVLMDCDMPVLDG
jgi:PleD family two-component response regulator